jgi:anthranilate phosphoribosyltransferase
MNYAQLISGLVEPGPDDESSGEALQQAFAAMLDGGVPELELGAVLAALASRPVSASMLLAADYALSSRVFSLPWPDEVAGQHPQPVVMPAYGAVRSQYNLTPLLATVLQRLHVPVLVHGLLEGHGGVASAYVFRELGVLPCTSLAQASEALQRDGLAFVPTGALAPGLAQLLSLRNRVGPTAIVQSMALMLDPFAGVGMRMIGSDDVVQHAALRGALLAGEGAALLTRGTEGEVFVSPRRRPRIELLRDGVASVLFDQEGAHEDESIPEGDYSPRATAAWTRRVLEGSATLPLPLLNQLACCLFAAGHAGDLNKAKAIVAVEARSLATAA